MAKMILTELKKKKKKKKSKAEKKGEKEKEGEMEKEKTEEDLYSFARKDEIKEGHLAGSLIILRRKHLEALLTPTLKDRYLSFSNN